MPLASKADTVRPPLYTTPLATVGEEGWPPVAAVHRGLHTFGVPEQLVAPLASKA